MRGRDECARPGSFGLLKADPPKGARARVHASHGNFPLIPIYAGGMGALSRVRSIIARSPADREAYVMAATIIASWMCAMMAA